MKALSSVLVFGFLLLLSVLMSSSISFAADTPLPSGAYYSLDITNSNAPAATQQSFMGPADVIQSVATVIADTAMSLLRWRLRTDIVLPQDPYQRLLQFGRWINDPTDDSCLNTRAKVLVRDSAGTVQYRAPRNCAVESGAWHDPYANQNLTESSQIQIDHVVPLKHAYVAGAWRWDFNTRCLYANFMGADYHLLSVSGHENMSKGDRSPDQYMPPDTKFRCEYLKTWLKIKATWKLAISVPEATAIRQLVVDNNCDRSDFVMTQSELQRLRTFIRTNINYCSLNKR